MHAIKGGWVGQTFALAKRNDSEGRKSRIRRSKEERKAMVESFIKKYQNSHNGNFPSLNLTHKEVGGSFYTVREIVREIIQENRVLGPAKLTPEEQNADMFWEQYPLGSISIEPQTHLASSHETHIMTHIVPNHHQDTSEEQVLNSSGRCPGPDHQRFDNEKVVNGSIQAAARNEESDKLVYTESRVKESLEGEKDVEKELETSKAKIAHITADVVVETFPLRPVSKTMHGLDGKSGETRETLEEKETQNMELEAGNDHFVLDRINFMENSSGFVDETAVAILEGPLSEKNCVLVDEKAVVTVGDPSLESSNCSTTKASIALDVIDGTNCEDKDSLPTGNTPMNAPNDIQTENINGTNTISTSSSPRQSIQDEAVANTSKLDIEHDSSSQKGSNPTLDRINLESWEGTFEKSGAPESNPLMAFFKAFIAAFVKLWSE